MENSHWEALASHMPVSAVNSLPDDILTLIFNFCKPHPSDLDYHYDSLTTQRYPWDQSYVCRRWRAIVLTSPLLWSTVQIDVYGYTSSPPSAERPEPKITYLLELSLQRSRNVELHVEIHDIPSRRMGRENRRMSIINKIVPILLSTKSRWGQLEILGFTDLLRMMSSGPFERLHSLRVSLYDGGSETRLTLFQDTPKLRKLGLESRRRIDGPLGGIRAIEFSWTGIRKFTTHVDGLIYLPIILDLEELHINYNYEERETLDRLTSELRDLTPFVLSNLHTITVDKFPLGDLIYQLSKRLRAPALETLELRNPSWLWDVNPVSMYFFPEFEHTNKLVNLFIGCYPDSSHLTTSFLSRTPSVTTLSLSPVAATPAVMEAIGRGVVPNLKVLCLHFSTIRDEPAAVISMLEHRAHSPASPIIEVRFGKFKLDEYDDDEYEECENPPDCWPSVVGQDTAISDRWTALCKTIDVCFVDKYRF